MLLRCLLLAVLVLALTQPRRLVSEKVKSPKFVFIAPEVLRAPAFSAYRPTIDSLVNHGFSLRWWRPDFAPIRPENWQRQTFPDSLFNRPASPVNYWQLVRALPVKFPNGRHHWVFAPTRLSYFRGERPTTPRPITWVPVELPVTQTWLQATFLTKNDQLLLLFGSGNEGGIFYEKRLVARPINGSILRVTGFPNLRLLRRQNQLLVQLSPNQPPVVVRHQPFAIAVVADKNRAEDVRVVEAALHAIRDFTQLPLQITLQKIPVAPNWVFWLSDQELSASVKKQLRAGATVWRDASAKASQNTTGWFTGFTLNQPFSLLSTLR